jgi:hypothetical protein
MDSPDEVPGQMRRESIAGRNRKAVDLLTSPITKIAEAS